MYPVSRKGSAYDRVATMFSPDGRLYQVEYASKIVEQGTIGVAMVYQDGILLGADKRAPSKLILPESVEKLFKIDNHIGAISAGLVGDARRLVQMARKEAQENRMYYEEEIHVETLVKELGAIKQLFTQYAGMRPFGVSFIVGGVDETGPRLFETEPSGALAEYRAVAIGKGRKEAMKHFEKKYKDGLTLDNAILLGAEAIDRGLGEKEKMEINNLEFAFISSSKQFEKIGKQKLKSLLGKK